MADTYFVSSLGTAATAAVGVTFSLMTLVQAIGYFFGHGSGTLIAYFCGKKDFAEAEKLNTVGAVLSFLLGALILVVGLLFLDPIGVALGSTPTILPYAKEYMLWILIAAPFMTASITINNQLRYQGSVIYGLWGMVIGAVLNCGLDPLFIFVFKMGVTGAGLATGIGQTIGFIILYIGTNLGGNCRIRMKSFILKKADLLEISKCGLPTLVQQLLSGFTGAMLNNVAAVFSDAAVAAIGIVQRIAKFMQSITSGFSQGFQSLGGYNFGAREYKRWKKGLFFCAKWMTIVLTCVSIIMFIFAGKVVGLFDVGDAEVMSLGIPLLRVRCISIAFFGILNLSRHAAQSTRNIKNATFVAIAREGLFIVPACLILPKLIGYDGLKYIETASDLLATAICVPVILSAWKKVTQLDRELDAEILIANATGNFENLEHEAQVIEEEFADAGETIDEVLAED